ncbi:cytochrome C oxidase subunit IV family protein [Thalassoglobus polymorphus]|uniref:Prokaryotic Cytochrome C oxidase subunit IV n=1 Tax=Thalassoglobus polymorphus TaxID=2527994 RepID=A0A517QRV5_9PLAN|nr:cytochrome C oxidase subunit IV family protein [Thalassoglobus polymorphus]QDT34357.1 hypothetical protein Mal48_36170 [Thalassoglobus polymorphus]
MDQSHAQSQHHVNYFLVFMGLCVCTALSVIFDVVEMSPTLVVIAVLAVAVAKATFVLKYFMHLKFEGRWKFVILMPTVILSIGLMIGLAPDVAMHYYDYNAMQTRLTAHHNEEGYGEGQNDHSGETATEAEANQKANAQPAGH